MLSFKVHSHFNNISAANITEGDYITVSLPIGKTMELKVQSKSDKGVTAVRSNGGVVEVNYENIYSARKEVLKREATPVGFSLITTSVPINPVGEATSYAVTRAQQSNVLITKNTDVKPLPRQKLCNILHIEAKTIVENSQEAKDIVQVMFSLAQHFSVRQDTYTYYRYYNKLIGGQQLSPWPDTKYEELSVADALQLQCTGTDCQKELSVLCDALELFCADALTPDEKYGLSRSLFNEMGRQVLTTALKTAAFKVAFNNCDRAFGSSPQALQQMPGYKEQLLLAYKGQASVLSEGGYTTLATTHGLLDPRDKGPLSVFNRPWWVDAAINPLTAAECRGFSGAIVDKAYMQGQAALSTVLNSNTQNQIASAYSSVYAGVTKTVSTVETLTLPVLIGVATGYMVYQYVRQGKLQMSNVNAQTCEDVERLLQDYDSLVADERSEYDDMIKAIEEQYGDDTLSCNSAPVRLARENAAQMYAKRLYDIEQSQADLNRVRCNSKKYSLAAGLVAGAAIGAGVYQLGAVIAFTSVAFGVHTFLSYCFVASAALQSVSALSSLITAMSSDPYIQALVRSADWMLSGLGKLFNVMTWVGLNPFKRTGSIFSKLPNIFGFSAFFIFGPHHNNSRSSLHAARQSTAELLQNNPHLSSAACRNWSSVDSATLFKIANDLRLEVNSSMSAAELCKRIEAAYPDQYLFMGSPAIKKLDVLKGFNTQQRMLKTLRVANMLSSIGLLSYAVRWLLGNEATGESLGGLNYLGFGAMLSYVNSAVTTLFGPQQVVNTEVNASVAAKKTFYDNVMQRNAAAQNLSTSEYPVMSPEDALKLSKIFTSLRSNIDSQPSVDLSSIKSLATDTPDQRKLRVVRRLLVGALGPHRSIPKLFHKDTGVAFNLEQILEMSCNDVRNARSKPIDMDSEIAMMLSRAESKSCALASDSRPTAGVTNAVYSGSKRDIDHLVSVTDTLEQVNAGQVPEAVIMTAMSSASQNATKPHLLTAIPETLKHFSKSTAQFPLAAVINAFSRFGYNFRTLGLQLTLINDDNAVVSYSLLELNLQYNLSLHGVTPDTVPHEFASAEKRLLDCVNEYQGLIPLANDSESFWKSLLWKEESEWTRMPFGAGAVYWQCSLHRKLLLGMKKLALKQLPKKLNSAKNAATIAKQWVCNLRGMFVSASKNLHKKQQLLMHCDCIDQVLLRNVQWFDSSFLQPGPQQYTLMNWIVEDDQGDQFAFLQDGDRILEEKQYVDNIPFVGLRSVNAGSHRSEFPSAINERTLDARTSAGYRLDPYRQQRVRDINLIAKHGHELLKVLGEHDEFDALGAFIETCSYAAAQTQSVQQMSEMPSVSAIDELIQDNVDRRFYKIDGKRGIVQVPDADESIRCLYVPKHADKLYVVSESDRSALHTKKVWMRTGAKMWAAVNATETLFNFLGQLMLEDYNVVILHSTMSASAARTQGDLASTQTILDCLYKDLDNAEEFCKKEQTIHKQKFPFAHLPVDVASRIQDSEWIKTCSKFIGTSSAVDITAVRQQLLSVTRSREPNVLFFMRPDGTVRDSADEICFAMSVYGDKDVCEAVFDQKLTSKDTTISSLIPAPSSVIPAQLLKWIPRYSKSDNSNSL